MDIRLHFSSLGIIGGGEYGTGFNTLLKRLVRQRDRYLCQLCGKPESLDVHHINYDKMDNRPDNLVTLCRSCHMKTTAPKRRGYYQQLFCNIGCFSVPSVGQVEERKSKCELKK